MDWVFELLRTDRFVAEMLQFSPLAHSSVNGNFYSVSCSEGACLDPSLLPSPLRQNHNL
jgi:hypothetical protein